MTAKKLTRTYVYKFDRHKKEKNAMSMDALKFQLA